VYDPVAPAAPKQVGGQQKVQAKFRGHTNQRNYFRSKREQSGMAKNEIDIQYPQVKENNTYKIRAFTAYGRTELWKR
jgi:hypothetical protein